MKTRNLPRGTKPAMHSSTFFCNTPIRCIRSRSFLVGRLWARQCRSQSLPTRNDRDLMQRMGVLQKNVDECMAGFVPRGKFLVFISHCEAAALAAPTHFIASFFELFHADGLLVRARRQQSSFVEKIRQFSA